MLWVGSMPFPFNGDLVFTHLLLRHLNPRPPLLQLSSALSKIICSQSVAFAEFLHDAIAGLDLQGKRRLELPKQHPSLKRIVPAAR